MEKSFRSNKVILIIGKPEVGKTTYLKSIISNYNSNKLLINDVNNEEKYKEFPKLNIEDLERWKSGKYRVFTDDEEALFEAIYLHLYNCMIIFEDATSYMEGKVSKYIRKLLTSRRHRNMDMIFTFHSLADVPPLCYRLSNYITLFKTEDSIHNGGEIKKVPNFQKVKEVWERVNRNPSQYYYETVKTGA
jgi:nucleoside-triphosphatase THEP1